jgi:threonine/homoserine/homoserine lactone efflux protein
MTGELSGFLVVAAVVIVTPGPDTALTIGNTLRGGRRAGIFTALGVAAGQAIWALATSLGLAALLIASEPVFIAVKLAGAAYLIVLGARALLAAWRSERPDRGPAPGEPSLGLGTPAAALGQGLLSNLMNPKMAAFFPSLLPQFVPSGSTSISTLVGLGLVFAAMTLVWLTAYAVVLARAGWLRRRAVRRALEAVTGIVLVAMGMRLALSRR